MSLVDESESEGNELEDGEEERELLGKEAWCDGSESSCGKSKSMSLTRSTGVTTMSETWDSSADNTKHYASHNTIRRWWVGTMNFTRMSHRNTWLRCTVQPSHHYSGLLSPDSRLSIIHRPSLDIEIEVWIIRYMFIEIWSLFKSNRRDNSRQFAPCVVAMATEQTQNTKTLRLCSIKSSVCVVHVWVTVCLSVYVLVSMYTCVRLQCELMLHLMFTSSSLVTLISSRQLAQGDN